MCQQFASGQTGGANTQSASGSSALGGTAVGTTLGAAAGAAFNGRRGAAIGAGMGLLGGSMIGAGIAQRAATSLQTRYDQAYIQCMYANGECVPVPGAAAVSQTRDEAPPPRPAYNAPPPPAYDTPPPRAFRFESSLGTRGSCVQAHRLPWGPLSRHSVAWAPA
ncbi:glycine zipper family protein [Paraburkholderia sp. CNPSo 3272]|nr:glycine zipper family protein [Paraburkholderia sp. CNPSo 3272]